MLGVFSSLRNNRDVRDALRNINGGFLSGAGSQPGGEQVGSIGVVGFQSSLHGGNIPEHHRHAQSVVGTVLLLSVGVGVDRHIVVQQAFAVELLHECEVIDHAVHLDTGNQSAVHIVPERIAHAESSHNGALPAALGHGHSSISGLVVVSLQNLIELVDIGRKLFAQSLQLVAPEADAAFQSAVVGLRRAVEGLMRNSEDHAGVVGGNRPGQLRSGLLHVLAVFVQQRSKVGQSVLILQLLHVGSGATHEPVVRGAAGDLKHQLLGSVLLRQEVPFYFVSGDLLSHCVRRLGVHIISLIVVEQVQLGFLAGEERIVFHRRFAVISCRRTGRRRSGRRRGGRSAIVAAGSQRKGHTGSKNCAERPFHVGSFHGFASLKL